ncbi:unnamed protein product [Schistosoma rodhaini]|uniref:Iwr1 domain-containing protein n=1 Tax=Schistosoma mansoni TaxID=6183 RepID=A0A3Q0KRS9_SCHMA|nr:unnamed protein product [Schistosoma rodhaini]
MSIFLRIKRPNTDCPSQICEAQNLIKRPKSDLQSIQFKYIGSQTSNSSLIGKIDKVCTSEKLCKIICNTSDATVVGENQTVKCQIKVNNLKRPAITTGVFDDFNKLNLNNSSKVSIGPNPPKIFKIIELTPELTDEAISSTKSTNNDDFDNGNKHQSDFMYDIYTMITTTKTSDSKCISSEQTIWCTNDQLNNDLFMNNGDNYIHDEYSWEWNKDYYDYTNIDDDHDDDEDDSNSESNWRNDYPDEKETGSSSSNYSDTDSSSNHNRNNEDSDYYY